MPLKSVHLFPYSYRITESQNHSTWKVPQEVSNLTSCSMQTQLLNQTKSFRLLGYSGLEDIQEWSIPNPTVQPESQSKKCSLTYSQPETALFQFMTISFYSAVNLFHKQPSSLLSTSSCTGKLL